MLRSWILVACVVALPLSAAAGAAPPTIDDINGTVFSVRSKGPEHDLAGGKTTADATITWTITKTGADTVSFDAVFGGMAFTAYYKDGFLLQATASPEDPPQNGSSLFVAVTGKPGKMKLKGALTVYSAGPGFNVLRTLKVSGKQTGP